MRAGGEISENFLLAKISAYAVLTVYAHNIAHARILMLFMCALPLNFAHAHVHTHKLFNRQLSLFNRTAVSYQTLVLLPAVMCNNSTASSPGSPILKNWDGPGDEANNST